MFLNLSDLQIKKITHLINKKYIIANNKNINSNTNRVHKTFWRFADSFGARNKINPHKSFFTKRNRFAPC